MTRRRWLHLLVAAAVVASSSCASSVLPQAGPEAAPSGRVESAGQLDDAADAAPTERSPTDDATDAVPTERSAAGEDADAVPTERSAAGEDADAVPTERSAAGEDPGEAEQRVAGSRWVSDLGPPAVLPPGWDDLLAADPVAIDTELGNGLRVIVRRNELPGTQAQLRLVVEAGSLDDEPDHLGSAHFLEHMMFNGTEAFPGNSLVPVLEGFGSAFGPDVNAYTSYGETVYQLTVPVQDDEAVLLGLEVLAQWATAATIDPEAVVAERGIVREEWRRRSESVGGRIGAAIRQVLLADSRRLDRLPIGDIDHIDRMEAAALRRFYETWYRPDNMAVIVVGDIDPQDTLAAVTAAFEPLTNPTVALPDRPADDASGGLASPVFERWVDPELTRTDLEVRWRLAAQTELSRAGMHQRLVADMATIALDRRLFESIERGTSVALAASVSRWSLTPTIDVVRARGEVTPDEATTFVAEVVDAAESIRQHGLAETEFTDLVARLRADIEQTHAVSASVQDSTLARHYVAQVLGESVVVDPDEERDAAIAALERITVDDVRRAIDQLLESNPYVLVAGPSAVEDDLPDGASLEQAYRQRLGAVFDAPAVEVTAAPVSELMAAPEPVEPVDRGRLEDLNAEVATFPNGVKVAVRQTDIVENLVQFEAWSRGGFFQETGPVVPLLGRTSSLVLPSGFGSIDAVDLDRLMGDRVVSLRADVGRATESLSGESSTDDLEVLMQLIHLQMTDAAITPLSQRRFDASWRPVLEDPSVRPTLAADLELWSLRYGTSPYFRLVPTLRDLDGLDADAQLQAWNRRFADADDFIWVFVGDLDPDVVFDLAGSYLASLPSTLGNESAIDRDPGLPPENLVATVEAGIGDFGQVRINWESPYPFTLDAEVTADVVELIVNARLRDVVREDLGASYSPRAEVTVLSEPKPWVDTIIELDTDPARTGEVAATIRDELERLRAGDIDPGYLERAIEQVQEESRFSSNQDWIERIIVHLAHPDRPAGEFRRRGDIAGDLTIADIAAAAAVIFPPDRSVEVRLLPATGD